jgi:methylamine---glutamate N-methyltransferase subunit C
MAKRPPLKRPKRRASSRKAGAVAVRRTGTVRPARNGFSIARTSTGLASLTATPAESSKYILGRSQIFTPEVINDIHIKSELGRYRMRGFSLFKQIPHWAKAIARNATRGP